MEGGGKQSRLLHRLLGKLRGDHHRGMLDRRISVNSTGTNSSTVCGSLTEEDDISIPAAIPAPVPAPNASSSNNPALDEDQFISNIDLRYGGQYLTPEQLPEFCDQLHNLVEVIRNIQSFAKVTGEYPSELERRLEQEAREVNALCAEARNARDVVVRTRRQRRALHAHKKHLIAHLASLKETEIRELESTVRLSDRKLFKTWESLKDSSDPAAFEPLLKEVKNKQTALDCLVRLVQGRRLSLSRAGPPPPLPAPQPLDDDSSMTMVTSSARKRAEGGARRGGGKRRRKEPRSVPLSGEPSRHESPIPVISVTQENESTSRYRVGSAGAVTLATFELPSQGSVRDILFFTAT